MSTHTKASVYPRKQHHPLAVRCPASGKAVALVLQPGASPQLKGMAVTPVFCSPHDKEFVFCLAQGSQRRQPKQCLVDLQHNLRIWGASCPLGQNSSIGGVSQEIIKIHALELPLARSELAVSPTKQLMSSDSRIHSSKMAGETLLQAVICTVWKRHESRWRVDEPFVPWTHVLYTVHHLPCRACKTLEMLMLETCKSINFFRLCGSVVKNVLRYKTYGVWDPTCLSSSLKNLV